MRRKRPPLQAYAHLGYDSVVALTSGGSHLRAHPGHRPRRSGAGVDAGTEIRTSTYQETTVAASTCDICAKAPSFGKSVSHSHRRTSRRWNPNIQSVRTVINGTSKRVNVCTSCLKAGKVSTIGA
ncbi:hypothetical protein GCM10023160_20810 [Brachybacterium paraconglomeratum]